jgi:hypothetical protein
MLDLGRMQEVPPHEQVLIERVETRESFATVPLAAQVDRFRHPTEKGSLVSVTAHLPDASPGNEPAIMARFTSSDGEGKPIILGEGSFRFIPAGDQGLIAQARANLPAGTWDLLVFSVDPGTGNTSIHRRSVVTRDPTSDLALSDVVLAVRLEPLSVAALASYDEPFHLGSFRVVPRAGNNLARGDALRIFYEIYGGTEPYRLIYSIEGKENDGRWIALGKPARVEQAPGAQGWEVPLGSTWPLGEYRVLIEVHDQADSRITAIVPFRLEG